MEVLRTPDERFNGLKEYPFEPHYTNIKTHDGTTLRIHHIDEGPTDGPILLAMHGQPVWSYLYARMIPFLVNAGIRVIAPDLPGYGKSDKPAAREDYSFQNQVDWMGEWLKENNFSNLTFFGQDWGGLIGLRMVAQDPDRFIKVSMGNTGLPYNPDVPQEVIDKVKEFRASDLKLTPMKMQKQIIQMDGKNLSKDASTAFQPALKFMYWQKFCWDTTNLPVGFVCSTMMEKRSSTSSPSASRCRSPATAVVAASASRRCCRRRRLRRPRVRRGRWRRGRRPCGSGWCAYRPRSSWDDAPQWRRPPSTN